MLSESIAVHTTVMFSSDSDCWQFSHTILASLLLYKTCLLKTLCARWMAQQPIIYDSYQIMNDSVLSGGNVWPNLKRWGELHCYATDSDSDNEDSL